MKRSELSFVVLAGILLAAVLLFSTWKTTVVLILDPMNSMGAKKMISNMAVLRDRAKAEPPDEQAVSDLVQSLHSSDSYEKATAANFLGQIGPHAELAVDELINVLNGPDLYGAREAASSLGEIGPRAHRAVPALILAVEKYSNADIGWFAAESLGKVAPIDDPRVFTTLMRASESPHPLLNQSSLRGLRELNSRKTSTIPSPSK